MSQPFQPWRVVHVDLDDDTLSPLEPSGEGGLFVTYWWRDLPLGGEELDPSALPMPASALRARGADMAARALGDRLLPHGFRPPPPERHPLRDPAPPLDALLQIEDPFRGAYQAVEAAERAAPPLSMSVVVCTRDRPEDLARCLEALAALTPPADEVIVVDNAPTDNATRRVVEEADVPGLRYIEEPRPGLSAARNAGLRAATGDLVAYTDDDVRVHPRWALRLRAAFTEPDVWSVTGLVLPAEVETEAQLLFERDQGGSGWGYRAQTFDRGFFERMRPYSVPVWQLGAGANMAFRREAFAAVGGFDERLGAGASGCSEDSEMWHRVLAAGARCRYEPSAVVFHTHRREGAALRSQMEAYLRGHVAALLTQYERERNPGDLRRATVTLPRYYGRWVVRKALGRSGGPTYLGAQIRGWAGGFGYYLRHRRRPGAPSVDTPS